MVAAMHVCPGPPGKTAAVLHRLFTSLFVEFPDMSTVPGRLLFNLNVSLCDSSTGYFHSLDVPLVREPLMTASASSRRLGVGSASGSPTSPMTAGLVGGGPLAESSSMIIRRSALSPSIHAKDLKALRRLSHTRTAKSAEQTAASRAASHFASDEHHHGQVDGAGSSSTGDRPSDDVAIVVEPADEDEDLVEAAWNHDQEQQQQQHPAAAAVAAAASGRRRAPTDVDSDEGGDGRSPLLPSDDPNGIFIEDVAEVASGPDASAKSGGGGDSLDLRNATGSKTPTVVLVDPPAS
jgi:hypothetical protein